MAVPNAAPSDNRAYILIIIVSLTLALALVLICCRFYVRIKLTKNLGWDDALIVLAAVSINPPGHTLPLPLPKTNQANQ